MGRKPSADQLRLYEGIDEILWTDWDPIGISGPDWPRDEYHGYLPQVFKLAFDGAAPSKIAKYLDEVVTERMGLSSSVDHDLKVAEKIRSLKLILIPEDR